MAIPDFQTLMLPLLVQYQDGLEHTNGEVLDILAAQYDLSVEELTQKIPSGTQGLFYNRVAWARTHLKRAGLLGNPERGVSCITPQGMSVLESQPDTVDMAYLRQFPEYNDASDTPDDGSVGADKDLSKSDSADERNLTEPFATIFRTWDEADWALNALHRVCMSLGMDNTAHPALSCTLRRYSGRHWGVFVNYYTWRVFGFEKSRDDDLTVWAALQSSLADEKDTSYFGEFSQPKPSESIALCGYQFANGLLDARGEPTAQLATIVSDFEQTARLLKDTFAGWSKSPFSRFHHLPLAEGVFDSDARRQLLGQGHMGEITDDAGPDDGMPEAETDHYFSTRTFELLKLLDADPTYATYSAEKEAFQEHLIRPFKQLMQDVADALPKEIASAMETEKGVFAFIHKNDYGQGGAWPYYWGAFYRKDGRRQEDGQLACTIGASAFGIFNMIGDQATSARAVLEGNLCVLTDSVAQMDARLVDGSFEVNGRSFEIAEPVDHVLDDAGPNYRLTVNVSPEDVVAMTRAELVELVVEVFKAYFPLVLASIHDDAEPYIREYLGVPAPTPIVNPAHTLATIASETAFPEGDLASWVSAVERKKQAILYGPPGTGKTFVAQHLAQHLVGGGDGFTRLIQFHPAYAYEDFIEGIRPKPRAEGLHYPVVPGVFRRFCAEAAKCEGTCVLIIDEINRANLARVFGELMYLLEYREDKVELAVSGDSFGIPKNVRILGTMNTADRSIALVDHALRRRFAFIALQPQYDVLRKHPQKGVNMAGLIDALERINGRIGDPNYYLGISFFLADDLAANLSSIWRMEIEPYLDEYFWGQADQVDAFRWDQVAPSVLENQASNA